LNILHIFLLSFFSCQNDINILLFFQGFSHNLRFLAYLKFAESKFWRRGKAPELDMPC